MKFTESEVQIEGNMKKNSIIDISTSIMRSQDILKFLEREAET